jgi:hypothetical protein
MPFRILAFFRKKWKSEKSCFCEADNSLAFNLAAILIADSESPGKGLLGFRFGVQGQPKAASLNEPQKDVFWVLRSLQGNYVHFHQKPKLASFDEMDTLKWWTYELKGFFAKKQKSEISDFCDDYNSLTFEPATILMADSESLAKGLLGVMTSGCVRLISAALEGLQKVVLVVLRTLHRKCGHFLKSWTLKGEYFEKINFEITFCRWCDLFAESESPGVSLDEHTTVLIFQRSRNI